MQKYQKVLSIAEALLRKVELPSETIQKYEELKLKILSEVENYQDVSSNEETIKALRSEITVKDQYINILLEYADIMKECTQNVSEISSNIFNQDDLPGDGFFEIVPQETLSGFQR